VKFIQIICSCDMTRATEPDRHVPAEETLYLAIGPDPDKLDIRELDLTRDWAKALREAMAPFLDASHEPGEMGTPDTPAASRASKNREVQEFNKARIEWAKAMGYNLTALVKGGYYPPAKTKRAYAHHLAGEDHLLTAEHKLQPDYDPATGNAI